MDCDNEFTRFSLLLTQSRLQARVHGVEQALHTCKHMLVLWRKVFEPMLDKYVPFPPDGLFALNKTVLMARDRKMGILMKTQAETAPATYMLLVMLRLFFFFSFFFCAT